LPSVSKTSGKRFALAYRIISNTYEGGIVPGNRKEENALNLSIQTWNHKSSISLKQANKQTKMKIRQNKKEKLEPTNMYAPPPHFHFSVCMHQIMSYHSVISECMRILPLAASFATCFFLGLFYSCVNKFVLVVVSPAHQQKPIMMYSVCVCVCMYAWRPH
jgi:hypothetical protein